MCINIYIKSQESVTSSHTLNNNHKYYLFSYLVWTGWDVGTKALLEVLSSNTGLSIEYIGGGDFRIFIFEKLRITEFVRKHFFLARFWTNWNIK